MSSTFFVGKVNRACNGGRLAGCGPCGRPPLQGKLFPIWGADGHKGRTLQMADTTHERPKVSLRALIFRSYNSAARLSPRLCGKIYTPLRESTCITARVSWGWVRIDCTTE